MSYLPSGFSCETKNVLLMQLKSTLTWDKQATGLLARNITRRHFSECFVKAAFQVLSKHLPIQTARMSKPMLYATCGFMS